MYDLGLKALRRLCDDQQVVDWYKAKLNPELFVGPEKQIFEWVDHHVRAYHALPQAQTLEAKWPMMATVQCPEPSTYYLTHIENAYFYRLLNNANIQSQALLKADQADWAGSMDLLQQACRQITAQRFRMRIMDLGAEAAAQVMAEYHQVGKSDHLHVFGWPYLDDQTGGVIQGDVVSFIGRPAQGKTWMMLYIALTNWRAGRNVLFVTMEMPPLAIAQRATSMYSHLPYGQLKKGQFSSQTYNKFTASMEVLSTEKAKLYVVDGNLAATVDEVFELASIFNCQGMVIDGAYLMKHPNKRLNKFERTGENVELMKYRAANELAVFASWQFSRSAIKGKKAGEETGLEDIGLSDSIGQVSSIVLEMKQEDSVETIIARTIRVMKGRSGEVGQFSINWGFQTMDFSQYVHPEQPQQIGHI